MISLLSLFLQVFRKLTNHPVFGIWRYVVDTFGVRSFIISLSEAQASMNSPDSKQKLMQIQIVHGEGNEELLPSETAPSESLRT